MGFFERLTEEKMKGKIPNFDHITVNQLRILYLDEEKSDSELAGLFEVKKSKVAYRRKKLGVTIRNSIIDEFLLGTSERAKDLNQQAKDEIFTEENVGKIAKALTHFAFRNGPVEDIHANEQLSQDDMKTLNKFMVNRLAYVFKLIQEERWIEFNTLIRSYEWYGHDWDEPELDDGGMRRYIELQLKELRRK
ncbi:MAG: hypothetical protein ACYCVD_07570 [Desulfitobacteriaceae bacterium]